MQIRNVTTILISALLLLAMVLLGLSGCATKTDEQTQTNTEPKGTVKLAYVNWSEGIAMTNLCKAILEDQMGYDVEITMADVAPVFASVAQGDNDAFMDAWLPVTHESYMEEYGEDIVDLGYNYENAKIGLVVPSYVTIDSIEQMEDAKEKFNGQIVGIDSGAGIMKTTEKAITEYGLGMELVASSGPAMTATLKDAIDNKEWVVVTGWQPHWKFARWELKFLEDPKAVYGDVEHIHAVARKGLEEDMPDVYAFLKNFKMTNDQLAGLMDMVEESDGEPVDAARQWMQENEDVVSGWIDSEG